MVPEGISDGTGRSISWYDEYLMVWEGVSDGTGRSIRCYKDYQMVWQVSDGTIQVSHGIGVRWYVTGAQQATCLPVFKTGR